MFSFYLVHNKFAMRFNNSGLLLAFTIFYDFVILIILIQRLFNLNNICLILEDYNKSNLLFDQYKNTIIYNKCNEHNIYYVLWIINEFLFLIIRSISIYLSYRAHSIIKLQIENALKNKKK